jgi:putative ABC transport system permease protein
MLKEEPGIDPHGVTVGQIWVPIPNDPNTNHYLNYTQRASLARQLLGRLGELPDVQEVAVGLATNVPFLSNIKNTVAFSFPDNTGDNQKEYVAEYGSVSSSYFDLLKIPLKRGRVFTEHDDDTSGKVVVVNEAFVRKYLPMKDPIGTRVRDNAGKKTMDSEIIGVVGNVREGLDLPPKPRIYDSILQRSNYTFAVFLRTSAKLNTIKETLTQTVERIDRELPVYGVRTMTELISSSMARRRLALFLMSILAAVALLLASLGIYGTMAFLVKQRVQEFGIRMALGAQVRDVLVLALRPALFLLGTGTLVGLFASIFVTRLMSSLLFGVSATDPFTFVVVPLTLGIVALTACVIPALSAIRVSPAQALRHT